MGEIKYVLRDKDIYRSRQDPVRFTSLSAADMTRKLREMSAQEDISDLAVLMLEAGSFQTPVVTDARVFLEEHKALSM